MRLDHDFTVPAPVSEAWQVLLDVPRIAPCMPGATLSEFDGETFTGTVKVKLGPVSLTYRGSGRFVETDEAARRVVIEASGKESRGSGTARATVTATLVAEDESTTRVDVGTDLTVTGRPAQFGRGMLSDVGARLIGQFADCLARTLAGEDTAASGGAAGAEKGAAESTPAPAASEEEPPSGAEQPARGGENEAGKEAEREVQPIDLFEVTGVREKARKAAPYALASAAAGAVLYLIRRRRRNR
ncbi:carbon monoxide dehydrogenase subunit G [Lipingzhangella halophila]|uniref:Carbon monoxide dehydrogenase subunit G n=1 Tax=Lipingzhangella halophila TaxID=1783352 RepID=A0A7W7W3E5_9ACTN|nr:SRPBCC family protein [Lipingzhangella halophila]MBB4932701.1 carbon monoxide dehydrogenase subunit G [Lipingzhangella halophila]